MALEGFAGTMLALKAKDASYFKGDLPVCGFWEAFNFLTGLQKTGIATVAIFEAENKYSATYYYSGVGELKWEGPRPNQFGVEHNVSLDGQELFSVFDGEVQYETGYNFLTLWEFPEESQNEVLQALARADRITQLQLIRELDINLTP